MKLTAFEFIAATDQPQRVVLRNGDGVILQFGVTGWIGVDLSTLNIELAQVSDLTIEGQGLGRPFWNGEKPTWVEIFDTLDEERRIATIRNAVVKELNRARILM